jgi:hypothetical protein
MDVRVSLVLVLKANPRQGPPQAAAPIMHHRPDQLTHVDAQLVPFVLAQTEDKLVGHHPALRLLQHLGHEVGPAYLVPVAGESLRLVGMRLAELQVFEMGLQLGQSFGGLSAFMAVVSQGLHQDRHQRLASLWPCRSV